jgi:hypothetical protein
MRREAVAGDAGRDPSKPATRLRADGDGSWNMPISKAETGRRASANPVARTGGAATVWLPTVAGVVAARRLAGEPQAGVPGCMWKRSWDCGASGAETLRSTPAAGRAHGGQPDVVGELHDGCDAPGNPFDVPGNEAVNLIVNPFVAADGTRPCFLVARKAAPATGPSVGCGPPGWLIAVAAPGLIASFEANPQSIDTVVTKQTRDLYPATVPGQEKRGWAHTITTSAEPPPVRGLA